MHTLSPRHYFLSDRSQHTVVEHLLTEGDRVHSTKQTEAENAKTGDGSGTQNPFQDSVAYYFCNFHNARSLRLRTILPSIFLQFAQMVEERILNVFPNLAQRQNQGRAPPEDINVLQGFLVRVMRLHKNKVIIVDGLDECEDAPTVLTWPHNIMVSEKNICVLVTSQPDQPFIESFDRDINLEDYIESTNSDIRMMLGGHIECPSSPQYQSLQEKRSPTPSQRKRTDRELHSPTSWQPQLTGSGLHHARWTC